MVESVPGVDRQIALNGSRAGVGLGASVPLGSGWRSPLWQCWW
jgi:hypothetical protein